MKQNIPLLLSLIFTGALVAISGHAAGHSSDDPAQADAATAGGRGGRVVFVTNLQDAGNGSLRAALEAAGPRMVLFRTSGVIELRTPVVVSAPHVTVAGQSAPGDGIVIRGNALVVDTHDVLLRHLTFERDGCCGEQGALRLTGRARRVQHDHCRFAVKPDTGWEPVRSILPPVDGDFDGMPDAFERRHGFDPHNPRFGVFDANRSGRTNLEEYLDRRDPRQPPGAAPARAAAAGAPRDGPTHVLDPEDFKRHIEFFNAMEPERVVNLVPNARAWDWLKDRIPFFECEDADLEEVYYFRWWALRKHLKMVGEYPVYTEFIELHTKAPFIPPERTIASALGHHFMETRWLRDQQYDNAYLDYWMIGDGGQPQFHFHQYSSWLIEALWQRNKVLNDDDFLIERFERLLADYRRWQDEQQLESGLYWQHDVWDAMEESISGSRTEKHIRPTINSYMYGNALALAWIADLAGRPGIAETLREEARVLRAQVLATLWNPESRFFEVVREDGGFAGVREAIGFIPWYFHLPEPGRGHEAAWRQAIDENGFWAPYGFTTAERRHPRFRSHGIGTCEWDGAVWPYATSQTLLAMANVLRDYPDAPVTRRDYFDAFLTYTRSQRFDGLPYIGEYQDEVTGYWLKGRDPRSAYYHHSTYADALITGVVGLRPRADDILEVDPLLPADAWNWFCLDGISYRGRDITIIWDKSGDRYGFGAGFHVLVDGNPLMQADTLQRLKGAMP